MSAVLPSALAAQSGPASAAAGTAATAPAPSSEASSEVVTLPPLVVVGETQGDRVIQGPFLAEVEGTTIYAGKKTSVIDFDSLPQIQTDNYRQAFAKTPGLLTSEVSNSALLSLSYRGIGDPHESQNLMVLKDGIPFVLDPFGYSTVYFAPPFESLDRLEFVSGGAALLYGSQPSGALNYITHAPDRSKPWAVTTQHILGSDNLYSTFSTIEGGNSSFGYLANFDHRSGDSFRRRNSDFELNGGDVKLVWDLDSNRRLTASFELYEADHGEPGGLTAAALATDRDQALLAFDRVRLDRVFGSVDYEQVGENALWKSRIWASEVVRYSKRENGGGFGTAPSGNLTVGSGFPAQIFTNSNTINQHTYRTIAADSRIRLDYEAWGDQHTATFGLTAMHIDAPIWNEVGATRNAERGQRILDADRSSNYLALFGENLFRIGRFTITPSVRLEILEQTIDETLNLNKTLRPTPRLLIGDSSSTTEPLFGLGSTFATTENTEAYANVSTAYKPATYSDAFPAGGNQIVSDTLDAAHAITYELGWRGRPTSWSSFDTSLFLVDYDNRFGTVTLTSLPGSPTRVQNVGRSVNQGLSANGEIDLYDLVNGPSPFSVTWYSAYQYLDAEFTGGSLKGLTPQYAPEHMVRTGLVISEDKSWKVAALLTYLSGHWANDNNTANNRIPAYTVLDLTAEARVWSGDVAGREAELWLLAGLNNALDEEYFSRVRGNGIDPANGRNYYVGLRAEF